MNLQTKLVCGLFAASALAGAIYKQANTPTSRAAEIAQPFSKFPGVTTRFDSQNFYVESNGMPDHELMTGITAWQQQVPIPQNYTGRNAWQFPLHPVPAQNPLSAKTNFFRGAIAIAADGVPIFNPIKNDGRTDTFLAGELDKWGGHSGRGDDYHYHISPLFLQSKLGKALPVAYALDGYAIYGLTEPDGTAVTGLDEFNGHTTARLGYHYHSTKSYPYLNGGFHGEVVERGGQVDPQPRAFSPREATPPLRGAEITGFKTVKPGQSYSLTYTVDAETRKINYSVLADGRLTFDYVDGQGRVTSQTYQPRPQRGGGKRQQVELGPPPGPRKPWFVDHAKGLDANHDGVATKQEVIDQCKAAFSEYAAGKDFIDLVTLPDQPTVRDEVGGFVKVHAKELDLDGDGKITEAELIQAMMRMFDKQDKNHDGKLSGDELTG